MNLRNKKEEVTFMTTVNLDTISNDEYDLHMGLLMEQLQTDFHKIVEGSTDLEVETELRAILHIMTKTMSERYGEGVKGYQTFLDRANARSKDHGRAVYELIMLADALLAIYEYPDEVDQTLAWKHALEFDRIIQSEKDAIEKWRLENNIEFPMPWGIPD